MTIAAPLSTPVTYVLGMVPFAMAGQRIMFDKGEVARAMTAAGFAPVDNQTIATLIMPMELDIARKAG